MKGEARKGGDYKEGCVVLSLERANLKIGIGSGEQDKTRKGCSITCIAVFYYSVSRCFH